MSETEKCLRSLVDAAAKIGRLGGMVERGAAVNDFLVLANSAHADLREALEAYTSATTGVPRETMLHLRELQINYRFPRSPGR